MTWLASLWSILRALPGWLLGALGALAGIALAYLRGRSAGSAAERARSDQEALEGKRKIERLEREIEGLSERELERRGRPWVRR